MPEFSQHFFIFSFYKLFSVPSLEPSNGEMPPGGSLKVTDKKEVDRCAADGSPKGIISAAILSVTMTPNPQNRMNAERAVIL
jgi:hypothetical protein